MDRSPTDIRIRKKSRLLAIAFDDGAAFELPFEYLRVSSPSAEVRGHGPGEEVLQTGKENVDINGVEPMGRYALRIIFDDGHETGLYTWSYLYQLGAEYDARWQDYLDRLQAAGYARQQS
jgi:DUF971 family protein